MTLNKIKGFEHCSAAKAFAKAVQRRHENGQAFAALHSAPTARPGTPKVS